ncbi:sugar transferase [Aurantiacibacter zhengii]|nr:sugar transferase [Aurantiacibacter zhengii]
MDLLESERSVEPGILPTEAPDSPPASRRLPVAPLNGLTNSLEHKRLQYYLLMMVADIALLLASYVIATIAYHQGVPIGPEMKSGLATAYLMLPTYLTIALHNGSYSLNSLTQPNHSMLKMTTAMLVSAALLNFFAFFAKVNAEFSRVIFTTGMFGAILLMAMFRIALSRWIVRQCGPNPKNQLVIYDGGPRFTLPYAYHVDAEEHGLNPDFNDPAALDRLAKYLCNMDEIVVSCTIDDRLRWAEFLKGSGRHGEIVSEFTREIGALGVIHHDSANVSSLLVSTGRLGMRSRVLKRLFDISTSLAALILLAPVMLVVALAIKLHDGGPVFFHQRRMGRGNQFFEIYKFRSMGEADANGDRSASKDDDRITPIGRFIRRTSIDELPQLINVLKGDMSHRLWTTHCAIRLFSVLQLFSYSCWQIARTHSNEGKVHRPICRLGGGSVGIGCATGPAIEAVPLLRSIRARFDKR